MFDERRIYQLTGGQHGLATRQQLRDIGMTDTMIRSRLEAGRLERVHAGVYRIAGRPTQPNELALAACLAADGLAASSHRTAARAWGVRIADDHLTEITVAASRAGRLGRFAGGAIVHRSVDLTPDQVVVRDGVPVTDPARTLVDLGAVVRPVVVEWAFDDLLSRKLVRTDVVRRRLERLAARGRSGCGVLREILDARVGAELTIGRSRLEDLLLRLCRRAGVTEPVFQHPIQLAGRERRIDFAFPARKIAIEVDGYEFHTRYDVFEDDRIRGNELELAGWMVLRFTWNQLVRRPDYVVRVLRSALAVAA
jgi:very-short-patch-repair endonuclease